MVSDPINISPPSHTKRLVIGVMVFIISSFIGAALGLGIVSRHVHEDQLTANKPTPTPKPISKVVYGEAPVDEKPILGVKPPKPLPTATPIIKATPTPTVTPTAKITLIPTPTPAIKLPTPTPIPATIFKATPTPTITPHPIPTPKLLIIEPPKPQPSIIDNRQAKDNDSSQDDDPDVPEGKKGRIVVSFLLSGKAIVKVVGNNVYVTPTGNSSRVGLANYTIGKPLPSEPCTINIEPRGLSASRVSASLVVIPNSSNGYSATIQAEALGADTPVKLLIKWRIGNVKPSLRR